MQTESLISTPLPETNRSGRAMFLTALLAVATLSSLCFAVVFIGGELRRHYSFANLVEKLEHGSAQSGKEALESYLADNQLYVLSRNVLYPFQQDARENKRQAVHNLFQVVSKISLNDYQGAVLLLRDLVRPQIDTILASMSLTNEDKALLHDILDRHDRWSKQVLTLAQLESTGPGTLQKNTDKIAEHTMLAQEVATQFAQFMSLVPQTYPEGAPMEFYEDGVLTGLPKLQNLPDAISDLHDLKQKLDAVGGKPGVQGPEAPQQFSDRIDSFRATSEIFRQTLGDLAIENHEIKEKTATLRKSVYRESQKVRKDIIALIEQIARPDISLAARWIIKLRAD